MRTAYLDSRMEPGKLSFFTAWWKLAKITLVFFTAFLLITPTGICGAFRNLEEGGTPPDFTLHDLKGMDHTLSAEQGRVVILTFFKPDQDKSIKTLNALTEIYETLKHDGLTVWAVTNGVDDKTAVEGIVNKLGIEYPVLIDEENKLYGEYGLFIFPATGIIDQGGKFAFEYASYGADFSQTVMNKAKVMLGLLSEADFEKSTEKKAIVELSESEKGAERNLQMAKVLLDRGFGSKAIPKVEKAVELNPNLMEARLLAGELYVEEGKFAEARQHLEAVLAANPRSNEAKVGLASVMMAEGDLDGAEAELQKAITLNPDPTLALYRLGQVYEKKGQTQKAMETYRNALEKILKK